MENNIKRPSLESTTLKTLVVLEDKGFEAYKDMILDAYATSDRLTRMFYGNNKEKLDEDKLNGVMSIISIVTNAKYNKLIRKEDKEKYNALVQLLLDKAADMIKIKTEEDIETYCKK